MHNEVLELDAFSNLSNDELKNLDGGLGSGFFGRLGSRTADTAIEVAEIITKEIIDTGKFIVGFTFGFIEGIFS